MLVMFRVYSLHYWFYIGEKHRSISRIVFTKSLSIRIDFEYLYRYSASVIKYPTVTFHMHPPGMEAAQTLFRIPVYKVLHRPLMCTLGTVLRTYYREIDELLEIISNKADNFELVVQQLCDG